MSNRRRATAGLVLASISAAALLGEAAVAMAQPYEQAPPPGYDQNQPPPDYNQGPPPGYDESPPPPDYGQDSPPPGYGPPPGQYAPPPAGADGSYSDDQQRYDQDYAARYSAWAARYCIDRRNNNVAAGTIIGGVLGSILGSGIAGRGEHFEGAVVGGALGATAGAAIGASSSSTYGCPPGYVVARGAPAFYFGGPVVVGPSWYNPWVWYGGHWTYRPYRTWYYRHPGYWRGHYHHRW